MSKFVTTDDRSRTLNEALPLVLAVENIRAHKASPPDSADVRDFVINWEKRVFDNNKLDKERYDSVVNDKLSALRQEFYRLNKQSPRQFPIIRKATINELKNTIESNKRLLQSMIMLDTSHEFLMLKNDFINFHKETCDAIRPSLTPKEVNVDYWLDRAKIIAVRVENAFKKTEKRLDMSKDEILELNERPMGLLKRVVEIEGCGHMTRFAKRVCSHIGGLDLGNHKIS
jgi:hypothetical protein